MITKLRRYILTGGTAAIFDLGGFHLLIGFGVPILAGAVISWLGSAVVNYSLTARFVFNHRGSVLHGLSFIAGASLGLLINTGVTVACASVLAAPPTLSKLIGIGVAFFFNFYINALLIFRNPAGQGQGGQGQGGQGQCRQGHGHQDPMV